MLKDKRALRKKIRGVLGTIDNSHFSHKSRVITKEIADWISARPEITKVALYSALPSEVDLQSLCEHLPKIQWYYPIVNRTEMSFHLVSNISTLTKGFSDILEPDPLVHPPILPNTIDLILCPGLAFTTKGSRLGRGGGFYDRFLSIIPDTPRIGVSLEEQLVTELPCENHDILMTHLATPSGVRKVIPLGNAA